MINKQTLYSALRRPSRTLFACSSPKLASCRYTEKQLNAFKERAEKYLSEQPPIPSFSQFNEYFENGARESYQRPYFEKRGRLLVFSVLAYETGESRYINALCEAIFAILNEYTWCLPAHMLDQDEHNINPEVCACHLDLFSCETGFALCEAVELCKQLIPDSLARMTTSEIDRRVFAPFERGELFFRFEAMKNNWSAVCGGAIGSAALYLIKDNARLASLLHRCLSCLDVYLASFGADGVCTEGVDYWNYGFGFYTTFAELLRDKTDGEIDLFKLPAVEAVARAGTAFYLGKSATVSFSDGSENGAYRMGLMSYLAKEYGFSLPCPSADAAADTLADNCYRYCTAIRDFYYADESIAVEAVQKSGLWLESAQWMILKGVSSALCAKAGNNGESHNHNDCGSFIFVKNGVHLISDLGAGLYDKGYFSEERYEYLVNRSRSHNVALLNGSEQAAGAQFAASDIVPREYGLTCELSGCYPACGVKSYNRSLTFNGFEAELCDRLVFERTGEFTEVFCSLAPIKVSFGQAVFERGGEKAVLSFDKALYSAEVSSEQYLNHYGNSSTAYFLKLTIKEKTAEAVFKATIA